MRTYFLFWSVLVLVACYPASSQQLTEGSETIPAIEPDSSLGSSEMVLDSVAYELNSDTLHDYKTVLALIIKRRLEWQTKYSRASSPERKDSILLLAGKDLENTLVQGVFPFWYGTPWDFNGISNVPGEGQIACGYFVSTTLKHVGFSLNRYKVAQQSSKKACEIFARGEKVQRISPEGVEDFKTKVEKLEPGLYCIGLDFHVGFLLKRNDRYFFIHSTYFGADGVVIEPIETSMAFYSQTYYVSPITTNKVLIKDWLNTREIPWNG
jgi:hypothetical protein